LRAAEVQPSGGKGNTVRTPSGILIITFYSNIGLGQNRLHWKANETYHKLMVQTANRKCTDGKIVVSGWPTKI